VAGTGGRAMTGAPLIAAVCAAEVLTMTGVFMFPALLPTFFAEWGLSNTEAGWIAGVYFGGYAAGVPVLVALTDRIDARRVYFAGAVLAAATAAAFAVVAEGFWSALVLRGAAGVALGATYMPGLKMLVDRYDGPRQSRAVALYTSSFSLGTATSFLLAGEIAEMFGWRWAFAASALAAAVAAAIVLLLPPRMPERRVRSERLLDFRPVFANRAAMGYVLGYGVHCWELFTLRSWTVAFLAFAVALEGGDGWLAPTTVATLGALVAMAASIGGNEVCVRFGRHRAITVMMLSSAAMALGFGFTAPPSPMASSWSWRSSTGPRCSSIPPRSRPAPWRSPSRRARGRPWPCIRWSDSASPSSAHWCSVSSSTRPVVPGTFCRGGSALPRWGWLGCSGRWHCASCRQSPAGRRQRTDAEHGEQGQRPDPPGLPDAVADRRDEHGRAENAETERLVEAVAQGDGDRGDDD